MGPKLYKVPSKCILIYCMCWFDLVRNILGFLDTSHAPITANYNLANKPYFCLGLSANLADLLRPVDAISTILENFDPFYPLSPSRYGIPMVALDDCWSKQTLFKFDMFRNPLEYGCFFISETDAPLLARLYFTWGLDCSGVSVLLLLSWATLGSWLGIFWDPTQDLKWTKYPWGQYSPVHRYVTWVAHDISNLGVMCLT